MKLSKAKIENFDMLLGCWQYAMSLQALNAPRSGAHRFSSDSKSVIDSDVRLKVPGTVHIVAPGFNPGNKLPAPSKKVL